LAVVGKPHHALPERPTVLLATQDAFFRTHVLQVLQDHGCPVVVVGTCYEALCYVLQQEFDCIIIDPEIKEMDGAETAKLIRNNYPQVPLIVASDERSFERGVQIAELGVYFRLGKPADENTTKEIVKSLIEKSIG